MYSIARDLSARHIPARLLVRVGLVAAVSIAGAAHVAGAASVEQMQVTRHGESYRIVSRISLNVPRRAAYKAATDFSRLPEYSPMVESTKLIGKDKLSSRAHMCIFWFCKTVVQKMRYKLQPPGRITMQVIPGEGDLSAGTLHWRFIAEDAKTTLLQFKARITPAFWVPPLIGPWAISRALRKQAAASAQAIEKLAREEGGKHS